MDKNLVKVRPIEPQDINTILEIENDNHKGDPRRFSKKQIMEFLADRRTRLFVIDTSTGVDGFLMFNAKHEKKAIIERLSVGGKRMSYGTMLLAEAIKLAQKAYADKIYAYVYEEDEAAIAFFKKNGFKSRMEKGYFTIGEGKKLDAIEFTKKVDLNEVKQ